MGLLTKSTCVVRYDKAFGYRSCGHVSEPSDRHITTFFYQTLKLAYFKIIENNITDSGFKTSILTNNWETDFEQCNET